MATQGIKYSVDLVLCIDATASMSSIIKRVKESALRFHDDLNRKMAEKSKAIDSLRVRVVAFRDFYADGSSAIQESPFFLLPREKEAFDRFVGAIHADGGGDEPESGLEALALAMNSEWATVGDRKRQLIVVYTDASAHLLEKNAAGKPPNYPSVMPANFDALTDMWEGQDHMNQAAKRLILYAPDAYAWTDIATHWENTIHFPSRAGEGLADVDYQEILDAIANSV